MLYASENALAAPPMHSPLQPGASGPGGRAKGVSGSVGRCNWRGEVIRAGILDALDGAIGRGHWRVWGRRTSGRAETIVRANVVEVAVRVDHQHLQYNHHQRPRGARA